MKTAVVICPGRGTYNKPELGYLDRNFSDKSLLQKFDELRTEQGQETLSALDGARAYSSSIHMRGDNASALIYAASLGDFHAIDADAIRIVAVTGNSMGWYLALACGGALSMLDGFRLANTMGALMQEASIGGQLIYPFVGDDWSDSPERKRQLLELAGEIDAQSGMTLKLSIDLGGMLVLAGNEGGLSAFETRVPRLQDRFPMRLPHHAAFHTGLQAPVAEKARGVLSPSMFSQPALPLIDGRGAIWWPSAVNTESIWEYTLGHQITETYDFTRATEIAAKEFAPDYFIITGPGTTLGGTVIQSLILLNWLGMRSKGDFERMQQSAPLIAAMGDDSQREITTKGV